MPAVVGATPKPARPEDIQEQPDVPDLKVIPDNVDINCHPALRQSFWRELVDEALSINKEPYSNALEFIEKEGWMRDYKGYPCNILLYHNENKTYSVSLQYQELGEWFEERVEDVPREAIAFVDKPYTTDMHLLHTFRHPIGIPDHMLPEAWRGTFFTGSNAIAPDVSDAEL